MHFLHPEVRAFLLLGKNLDQPILQINPQHYLPVEEGAAGDAYPHTDLPWHHHRMMLYYDGDEDADDHQADVHQYVVPIELVLRITGKIVDDPTLDDRLH